ncbi:MAG: proton-conducting transporter membrane subunit, partial [Pirellulaceae bacterium]|nr:proton-conducting transporter membrane subunit [Pirellulaceae bacterium]
MNLHELVSQLIVDTKGTADGSLFSLPSADSSLGVFLPEICLCVTIVLMLLVRVFRFGRRVDAFYIAAAGSLVALCFVAPWQHLGVPTAAVARMEIFTGMLVYDPFSIFIRSLLLGFAFLFTIFTKLSGIPDREDGPDIYTMVLGATLGMCLMASANHLLMVFMAIEMASVPSYVLAGMMKGRRVGSEAALKYSIYGAGAAGVMLYGISLVSGLLNTAHLPTIALTLSERLPTMQPGEMMVLVLAALMIMVGLAFKLSAVPFHFWCPDVFEG